MIDSLGEIGVDVSGETATIVLSSCSDSCVWSIVGVVMWCCVANASMMGCRCKIQAFFLTGGRWSNFSNGGRNR